MTDQTATPDLAMTTIEIRPSVEVAQRLSVTFGPHFAEYFWDHFTDFGKEMPAVGLCNRLVLLLADYSDSLPAVARTPWEMSLNAFRDDLMPAIVTDRHAGTAAALWAALNVGGTR